MDEDEALKFYNGREWKKKRAEVLKLDNYECVICKAKGRYSKAAIVHHVKHLRDCPELGLEIYHEGQRQLVSLCKSCHEDQHPEAFMQNAKMFEEPLTVERWD